MTFLFTRSVQLGRANVLDSMAWSVKMTEKVNAISETPVRLWTTVMSPDVGRLTWTTTTEDISTIAGSQEKLLADSGYLDLVEEGASYTNGAAPVDGLVRLVHADSDGVAGAKYSTVARAVLAPLSLFAAMKECARDRARHCFGSSHARPGFAIRPVLLPIGGM